MEKQNKGKTIVIIILVLAVLGLGGYIVYDKFIGEETKQVKIEQKNENLLSKDEALTIGKERYEYVRDGLYLCGYKQVKLDTSKDFAWTDTGVKDANEVSSGYYKITNIDEIKQNLTTHAYLNWVKSLDIKQDTNEYYMVSECGSDPTYVRDQYKINVKNINENNIVYSIDEYFYSFDENGVIEDINKAEKYTIDFEIVKEDNNWKIKEYTNVFEMHN